MKERRAPPPRPNGSPAVPRAAPPPPLRPERLISPLAPTRRAARGLRIGEVSLVTDLKAAAECLRILQAHEVWSTHGRWIDSAQPRFGPGVAERFVAARGVTAEQARAAGDEGAPTIGRAGARF